MPAYKDKAVIIRFEPLSSLLVKGLSLGRHVYNPCSLPGYLPLFISGNDKIQAGFKRLRHHYAAEASPVRVIVHLVLSVLRKVADLNGIYFNYSFGSGSSEYRLVKNSADRIRKKCKNVDLHLQRKLRFQSRISTETFFPFLAATAFMRMRICFTILP